mgnify:FL=1
MSKTLPLTPFERCMLLQDSAAYPCHCFIRLHFQGRLDREAFTAALQKTLPGHPLLRATVTSGWRDRWSFADGVQPELLWCEGETGGPLPQAKPIDLGRESGLKVYVVQGAVNVEVTFQFHHACCDGAGMERFIDDLFVRYAHLRTNGEIASDATTVDPDRVASRGTYGLRLAKLLKLLPGQMVGLLGAAQFLGRHPKPLLDHPARDRQAESTAAFPSLKSFRFEKSQTLALRNTANERNVTLHELLVRDFFLALWDWQKELDQYHDRHWVRMMIPMNMRDASYRSLPAMNYVSSVFLDRRGKDSVDRDQLLNGIHDEMQVIKRFQLEFTFLWFLKLLHWIPGGLKRSVQQDTCQLSVIFSNTGKMTRRCPLPRTDGCLQVADLVLHDMDGLAPLRPYNCVTMLTLEYAHRLKLNLHYDAQFVTARQSEKLMDLFVARLHDSIQSRVA